MVVLHLQPVLLAPDRAHVAEDVVHRRGAERAGGDVGLTWSAAALSGPAAFEEAGIVPSDIKYASIYDSFTISVLIALEDNGQSGILVGCGDSAIPISVTIPPRTVM